MTKFKLFRLKNEMIFANAFANLFSLNTRIRDWQYSS